MKIFEIKEGTVNQRSFKVIGKMSLYERDSGWVALPLINDSFTEVELISSKIRAWSKEWSPLYDPVLIKVNGVQMSFAMFRQFCVSYFMGNSLSITTGLICTKNNGLLTGTIAVQAQSDLNAEYLLGYNEKEKPCTVFNKKGPYYVTVYSDDSARFYESFVTSSLDKMKQFIIDYKELSANHEDIPQELISSIVVAFELSGAKDAFQFFGARRRGITYSIDKKNALYNYELVN